MATQKQISANRRNAQKSTGPKSDEGKAVSSLNAVRHGFTAQHNVLSIEEAPEFDALRDEFLAEHQPATPTEFAQFELMVSAFWRLRRLRATETAFLDREMERMEDEDDLDYRDPGPLDRLAGVYNWHAGSAGTLALFSRYEGRLERSFYRALHELERLRAQRPAAPAPAVTETKQEPKPDIGFVSSDPENTPAPGPGDGAPTAIQVPDLLPDEVRKWNDSPQAITRNG